MENLNIFTICCVCGKFYENDKFGGDELVYC